MPDVNDSGALEHLSRLSLKNYSNNNCAAALSLDSWVPNTGSTVITCPSGISAVDRNCSDLVAGGCPTGCFGFTQQLGTSTNNDCANNNCTVSVDVVTQTDNRYGSSCIYADLLQNINTNYDGVRQANLATLKADLQLANGGLTSITNYGAAIENVIT